MIDRARDSATLRDGSAPASSDVELLCWVERCLGTRADDFAVYPLADSTSFACELLTVRSGGRAIELFFKDFGRCRLPLSPGEIDERSAREIEVYRQLLDPESLGTARHFGSLREEGGRSWLLLEHVRGWRLADHGFEHWLAAAAWVGRLQGLAATRSIPQRSPALLPPQDAGALRSTAEEAVRTVTRVDRLLGRRLRSALEGYEGIVEELGDQPRTLVHGSFRPENILVDTALSPARIAPVDWEDAALGSALHDVAFLSAGMTREQVEELLRAQREAAAEHGLELPSGEKAWELVTILRLHKLLRSLGRSVRWACARETVEHLIVLAERLSLDISDARRRRMRSSVSGAVDGAPHPALRAWRSLSTGGLAGDGVELLRGGFFRSKGRAIFRLGNVGPGGMPVVAKHCSNQTGELEHLVYTEVLPRLGVSFPGYLGLVPDGRSSWEFLEDVGALQASKVSAEHRVCAARWLGELQAASGRLAPPAGLPGRGPWTYLEALVRARAAILSSMGNPALSVQDRELLRGVIATCDRVEAGWHCIEAPCASMPKTLVHGDFRPKNLFLRQAENGLVVLPIDWEFAGWGVCAIDLGALLRGPCTREDLAAYHDALGAHVDEPDLRAWVCTGRVFRALASIQWTSTSLPFPYVKKPVDDLARYRAALAQAFEELVSPGSLDPFSLPEASR